MEIQKSRSYNVLNANLLTSYIRLKFVPIWIKCYNFSQQKINYNAKMNLWDLIWNVLSIENSWSCQYQQG